MISAIIDFHKMNTYFFPPRQTGLLFHAVLIFLLLSGSIWSLNQSTRAPIDTNFTIYLFVFSLLALPVPLLTYRLYSLLSSSYSLDAATVRLRWGFRVEEIPLMDITWVRQEDEIDYRLPKPLIIWPGAILGNRRLDRESTIEYMASQTHGLVLIETTKQVFAISPEDPVAFTHAFHRVSEQGIFEPVPATSIHTREIVGSIWNDFPARLLVISAFLLALVFGVWIVAFVDPQPGVAYPLGETGRVVNTTLLFLLPVMNSIYFLFDLFVGLFFYRLEDTKPLAYLLWGSSIISSFFFFAAVLLLIQT